jgi:hypothetical protein
MAGQGGYLGKFTRNGKTSQDNPVEPGGWTIEFSPADLPKVVCEAFHMAVQGPPSSQFQVYIDNTFYDNVVRGDINSWDPSQPMLLRPGDTVFLHYNTASGTAPKATLFLREPSPVF